MCGLTGIFSNDNSGVDWAAAGSVIARMSATLSHRGPDASGVYLDDTVALAHRRLSILDMSETGAQPMELRPGGPVISYNGECYNFIDLRRELVTLGHRFRGTSDTEVILHAYDQWGLDGLKRLEGIFAIALWDRGHKRLVLMRDRFGVKPLYFGACQFGLAFGSEIKAVLAAGGVDKSLNDQAFSEYLWYGNSYEDRTFYRGVHVLLPGHWMVIKDGCETSTAWWTIEEWLQQPNGKLDSDEAASSIQKAIDSAVSRQLVSDVPVGIFLSGGVDSSAIAASAMSVQKQPLASYSAAFDFDVGPSELPKARKVAELLGLDHHELKIDGKNLEKVLFLLASAHDEPFADAANIPLYLMCRALEGKIKVVLQGDGGDELFAGYRRYAMLRNAKLWSMCPSWLPSIFRQSGSLGRRCARMLETAGNHDPAMRMAHLLTMETIHNLPERFLKENRRQFLSSNTDPFLAYRNAASRFRQCDSVNQMLLTDLTVQLPSQFLPKVDRATMAMGIEARVPLLDENVARIAVGLPCLLKVNGSQKKIVLRQSQRSRLPTSILDSPKTGFGVPYGFWLRTSLYTFACERLLDSTFLDNFSLDLQTVENAISEHQTGKADNGFMLWKLLQLSLWNK
jgi:asparagine synthase (glutamine-hydrolysing)